MRWYSKSGVRTNIPARYAAITSIDAAIHAAVLSRWTIIRLPTEFIRAPSASEPARFTSGCDWRGSARGNPLGDVAEPLERVILALRRHPGDVEHGLHVVQGQGLAPIDDPLRQLVPCALDDEVLEDVIGDHRCHPGDVSGLLRGAQLFRRSFEAELVEDERVVGCRSVERHLRPADLPPTRALLVGVTHGREEWDEHPEA